MQVIQDTGYTGYIGDIGYRHRVDIDRGSVCGVQCRQAGQNYTILEKLGLFVYIS